MDALSALVLQLAFAAIGLVALFYVIRAAVLSALRTHRAEVDGRARAEPPSHLDADGI
ncbi:hypothetical protein JOD63_003287 [Microbacterium terrae]|uniref:Uncharacterized protein n=1 Tax=Microbacterium terrae TaxID=69369 RepID=A0A0M2H8Y8_9MICO|nr:hypothetical protein [Microbacterium terrae]KJL42995.1 hypothetical protein RS81_00959 [Microbacterium terrae]MBP1079319.1 hypothetical protein [Microbacterium terrae]